MFKSFTTSQTKPTSYREEIVARKRLYRPYVTDGLVSYYDYSNRASSPGGTTSLYNLIPNQPGYTTLSEANGAQQITNERFKHLRLDGVNDYLAGGFSNGLANTGGGLTVEMIARIRSSSNSWLIQTNQTNTYTIQLNGGGYSGSFGFNTGQGNIFGISASEVADLQLIGTNQYNWHYYSVFFPYAKSITSYGKIYIDGVQQTLSDQLNPTTYTPIVNSDLYFGAGRGNLPMNVDIAEIRLYPRELSAREVAYNYGVAKSRKGV